MPDPKKTVFISYRRSASRYIARAIFQGLHEQGYDVFMDTEDDPHDPINLNQITARMHFVVILMPGAVEACESPQDGLRAEIEKALVSERHVIPLLVDGFAFPKYTQYLTGELAKLPHHPSVMMDEDLAVTIQRLTDRMNADSVTVPGDNGEEGSTRDLQTIQLQTIPLAEQAIVQEKISRTQALPKVSRGDMSAEQVFGRALKKHEAGDLAGAIEAYAEAITLNSNFAEAYNNRGICRLQQGKREWAIADFDTAIRLIPRFAKAYYNRGNARYAAGEFAVAESDHSEAININSDFAEAYNNRGMARYAQQNFAGALEDYNKALEINPTNAAAFNNRGNARRKLGDLNGSIVDYSQAIVFKFDFAEAYSNRGIAHERLSNWSEAREDYQMYLQLGGGVRYGDTDRVEQKIASLQRKSQGLSS